jgi:hypothetical protein
MKTLRNALGANHIARIALVSAVVLVTVLSAAYLLPPTHGAPAAAQLRTDTGSTQQWAFAGVASASYSCSGAGCFPGGTPPPGTFSISAQYYIEWVVIYTQTNVSSTQTQFEAQSALNATLKESVQENATSLSVTLNGKETSWGFTNVTSAGSVDVTSGAATGPTPALAVENAASSESYNFSGNYQFTNSTNATDSGSLSFVVGADETSGITFATPLGLVPLAPVPGETWGSNATFTAHGGWTTGYTISGSADQRSYDLSNWTNGFVTPSGNLFANGTDLGQFTLWDNYTSPATTETAQLIAVQFDDGAFSAADGWVFVPVGMYGILSVFSSDLSLSHSLGTAIATPAQATLTNSENAYYQKGPGFIGASESGNASSSETGGGGPSISLNAGPEPVSVAQQQYSGVTGTTPPSGGSSSTSSFPWTYLIVGVVVLVVIVGVVVVGSRRRRPPAPMDPGYAAMGPAVTPAGSPAGPAPPTPPMQPGSAVAPMAPSMPAPTPVCPTCGQPSTYVAQYGRYYCYNDRAYL